jgi:hypothetical protein
MLAMHAGERLIAIEATGSLHRAWAAELERLHLGSLPLFVPSENHGCPHAVGSGRFKTDDRDRTVLTYVARQGAGRRQTKEAVVEELRAAVRHRPVAADRDPDRTGSAGVAVAFAVGAPSTRSLSARAPGKLTKATAEYWASRWRDGPPPPPDVAAQAERLGRDLDRYRRLPIARVPDAEQLNSATGLVAAMYESATGQHYDGSQNEVIQVNVVEAYRTNGALARNVDRVAS